jgi:hypothetical protein
MYMVGFAVLDHFGVAARECMTPALRAACAHGAISASRIGVGRPASSTKLTTIASARAPETARSFTVPLTASSPMDPPGKRSGLDDKTIGGHGDAMCR